MLGSCGYPFVLAIFGTIPGSPDPTALYPQLKLRNKKGADERISTRANPSA